jgi:hypothetical protein
MSGVLDRNIANLEAALKYSDLTPEERAQVEKDLQEARANKGGWEDKVLSGDPVPESKMSPEQRAGIRELMAARSGDYSGLGPHRGMPLSAEDRQTYLAELLENDPASSLYDLSTVKDFSEEENPYRKARMSKDVAGYYADDTAYVKDLDKLGTRPGPFKGGEFDKQLASVASHELTHPKVEQYGIDMSNIEEPRELPTDGRLHDGTYMPHEKEELLTRMIEMQNFPEAANAEWYFGKSPYAISKHPSGAEGYEAGKILQRSLEPSLQKYNQLIEAEKNPLIYDEATGYNRSDLQRRGIGSFSPHGFEYGNQWQQPENEDENQWEMPNLNTLSKWGSGIYSLLKGTMPWTLGAQALTGGMGNLATQLRGGYKSQNAYEQARDARRTQSRIDYMMDRRAAGKDYSETNLKNLLQQTGQEDTWQQPKAPPPPTPRVPDFIRHGGGGDQGGGDLGKQESPSDAAGTPFNRGGLAALWQRY